MNPMNLMQMIGNPQQFLQNVMGNSQIMGNPIAKNAVEMMQSGNTQGIEQMARNLCREKGLNADDVMNQLKGRFGMK